MRIIPLRSMLARAATVLALSGVLLGAIAQTNDLIRHTVGTATLLSAVIVTGAGAAVVGHGQPKTYQAFGTTSGGAGTAVIAVQCSVDSTNWDTLGTISLTLATSTSSNSFASNDRCRYVRGNVTTLTGTGAAVTLLMAG